MSLLPIVLDTETTGVNTDRDSIVQFAALIVEFEFGTMRPLYETLCNPGRKISEDAAAVHGIHDSDVEFAIPAVWALQHFKNLLDGLEARGYDIILCGANHERFDIPLMDTLLPTAKFRDYLSVDSYTMALREFPDMPHKVGEMYEWYCSGDASQAHDAMADCRMVADILTKYINEKHIDILDMARQQEEAYVLDKFPFGKHKGVPIREVPTSYIQWCRQNFTDVHKDVEATICVLLECDEWVLHP